jgi:hypothetical protein
MGIVNSQHRNSPRDHSTWTIGNFFRLILLFSTIGFDCTHVLPKSRSVWWPLFFSLPSRKVSHIPLPNESSQGFHGHQFCSFQHRDESLALAGMACQNACYVSGYTLTQMRQLWKFFTPKSLKSNIGIFVGCFVIIFERKGRNMH